MFERVKATFWSVTEKTESSIALEILNGNSNLLNKLETLQDYELSDEVLREKMLGEFRAHIPVNNWLKRWARC